MLTSPWHAYNDLDFHSMFYSMFSRRLLLASTVIFLNVGLAGLASPAAAQSVTGLGEDAALPPVGNLRLKVQSEWGYYDQRFVTPASGGPTTLQPLGARFTLDTLGARQLSILRPLQDSLRALGGNAGISVSLGSTRAQITDRVTRVPITIEAGISRWLSISATVPIVHTSASVFFSANPTGREGNLGFNPALTSQAALAADTSLAQQLVRAAGAVRAYCGGSGAGSSQCASAPTLITGATAFGQSAASFYTGGVFAPTTGSDLLNTINARAQSYRAALNAFAGIPGSGVPSVTASALAGSPTPLTTGQLSQVLTDPGLGVQLDPLQTIVRTHIGDVEVAAKLSLFDSFRTRGTSPYDRHGVNARVAIAGGYRFPTGQAPSPDNLVDIGTGTHQSAVIVRAYTDLLVGQHFWTSLVGRYTRQTSSDVTIRYAAPGEVFPGIGSRLTAQRQLGNVTELEVFPRWEFNRFMTVGAQYLYRHKPADSYATSSGVVQTAAVAGGFDPLNFGVGSEATEHRVGGGVAFSNVHAVQSGRARFPFDVSYLHSETIRGGAGKIPKLIIDQIQIRLYRPLRR